MESKELALLCRELADDKKAEDIVILDVRKVSSVTDYFVIASGTSQPHLRAIVEEISGTLREDHDLRPSRSEGATGGNWVVLDYFDVIVHVMHAETRRTLRSRRTVGRRQAGQARQAAQAESQENGGRGLISNLPFLTPLLNC